MGDLFLEYLEVVEGYGLKEGCSRIVYQFLFSHYQ